MIRDCIKQAINFTEVYKKYENSPIPIREAMCLKEQYPLLMTLPYDGDLYAGRRPSRRITYMGSVTWFGLPHYTTDNPVGGKQGGYCFDFSASDTMDFNEEEKEIFTELATFWKNETTMSKIHAETPIKDGAGFLFANDLDKLVSQGLPGIIKDINAMPDSDFKTGLQAVYNVMIDLFRYYIKNAEENGKAETAKNISAIIERAPETVAEALQLILLFELFTHEHHYELHQLDVALGDIYVAEIDNGMINEEQATEQIKEFYKIINESGEVTVCRLVLGGKDRRNEENANRFIKAALKAEQLHKQVTPQVSLRIYAGMDAELLNLAYDTIAETCSFPLISNDDAIIPGVAEAYSITLEEANDYYPLGCGEMILAPHSPGILVMGWGIPKTVDAGVRVFHKTNGNDIKTFEELYSTVVTQIKNDADEKVHYHRILVDTQNKNCAFLPGCFRVNDCLKNGKPLLNGGARYCGAVIMGHGFTNAADGLYAIKKVVYEDRTYKLSDVIDALDADFVGYEDIQKCLIDVPKYGNDDVDADMLTAKLWHDISVETRKAGKYYGFDFFTVSSVNPGGYHEGLAMGATADGRKGKLPFAIGNAPTAGADKNGLTALMNSVLKTHPANGGTMTNFKLSRSFIVDERDKFDALFAAYWADGGLQATITVVNKGDLEAALKAPEKYPNLLVRLGGWTARFVDLDATVQKEILTRTLY